MTYEEGLEMRAWHWIMRLLFGMRKLPLNEKLRQVIQMDRGGIIHEFNG